jgi:hypothetical protein
MDGALVLQELQRRLKLATVLTIAGLIGASSGPLARTSPVTGRLQLQRQFPSTTGAGRDGLSAKHPFG